MRVRRAATCLSVARSAAASGRLSEAVVRLEEACALDPGSAEARVLLEELRLQASPVSAPVEAALRREHSGWTHWLAAGIAICALAALAFLWPTNRPTRGGGLPPHQTPVPVPSEAPAAVETQPSLSGLAAEFSQPAATSGEMGAAESTDDAGGRPGAPSSSVGVHVTEQRAVTQPAPVAERAVGAETPTAAATEADARRDVGPPAGAPAVSPAAAALPSPVDAPPRLPPLERAPVNGEDRSRLVPSEAVTGAPLAPTSRRDASEASMRSELDESGAVEATLQRYADAYKRLDAAAARAVWPTVDERALARAFEGLESQGITFDHCDVAVAGSSANAACAGRARFVPKVGSREPLVEQRRWTFRLRKADDGWEIVQAEAK